MPGLDAIQTLLAGPNGTEDPEMPIGDGAPVEFEAVTDPTPKRPRGRPRKVPGQPVATPSKPHSIKPGPVAKAEIPMPPAGVLAAGVANVYVFAGMGLGTVRPQTGMALASNASELGKAWEDLAAQNPAVRRALLSILQTSVWGALIGAHIPVLMIAVQEGQQIATAKREAVQSMQEDASIHRIRPANGE